MAVAVFVLTVVDFFITPGDVDNPDAQLAQMLPAERAFCEETLWRIDSHSNQRDVLALLGAPERSLPHKKNWFVKLDGKKDRVGVYFTLEGYADEVVLDGGPGRFYYRRSVTDHEKPKGSPAKTS